MADVDLTADEPGSVLSRRNLLKAGGSLALGAGAFALAACETASNSPGTSASAASSTESLLDKWVRTKTANIPLDGGFPPLQSIDSSGKYVGYQIDLTNKFFADLGVTPNYSQLAFANQFAAVQTGRFDMMGIASTILPTRQLRGNFAGFPIFFESAVVFLKPGSKITSADEFNSPSVTLAVLGGSSFEQTAKFFYPKAQFVFFTDSNSMAGAVATGRADALMFSDWSAGTALAAYPNLRGLPGPPLFLDIDTFFMPTGDEKLWYYVTNWLRYNATHDYMLSLWEKWVVPTMKGTNITTNAVSQTGGLVPITVP